MRHLIASTLAAFVIAIWSRPISATRQDRRLYDKRPSTPPLPTGPAAKRQGKHTPPESLPSLVLDAYGQELNSSSMQPAAPAARTVTPPRDFWCECVITDAGTYQTWPLRSYHTVSPALALRWMEEQAVRLAEFIDPTPGQGWAPAKALRPLDHFLDAADEPDPATAFRMWPNDIAERDQAQQAMQDGADYTFRAADRHMRYRMSIHPIPAAALPAPGHAAALLQKESA